MKKLYTYPKIEIESESIDKNIIATSFVPIKYKDKNKADGDSDEEADDNCDILSKLRNPFYSDYFDED